MQSISLLINYLELPLKAALAQAKNLMYTSIDYYQRFGITAISVLYRVSVSTYFLLYCRGLKNVWISRILDFQFYRSVDGKGGYEYLNAALAQRSWKDVANAIMRQKWKYICINLLESHFWGGLAVFGGSATFKDHENTIQQVCWVCSL